MEPKKKNPNFVYDAFGLIQYAWNKKWILIALSLMAFILSIIVSLNMKPRYYSVAILYPAASFPLSRILVETTTLSTDNRDVLSFGGDFESERLIQILHSSDIQNHVAKKFNLMEHYKIKPESPFPENQLKLKWRSNVKIRRTEYMSVEIGVTDTKAKMAADIANEIVVYVDSVYYNMSKERAMDAFTIVKKEYEESQNDIRHFSDSLQQLRQKGMIDYESQATALNTAYANSLEHGNTQAGDAIKKQINILSMYGGKYVELSQRLQEEITRMNQLKAKYAASRINIETIFPHVFVVEKARVEEKKISPKRTMIVVFSTFSTFAFALILLLINNNIKARN